MECQVKISEMYPARKILSFRFQNRFLTDDHPSPQTPIYPSPLYTPAEVLLQKGPRPFLPFPGMALSGPPPMGFAPPHPSTAVPVLPFYGVPLTGTYMRPTSQLHPQSNPMTFPPPAEEEIEMKKAEYSHDAEAETISEPSEENEGLFTNKVSLTLIFGISVRRDDEGDIAF